MMGLRRCQFLKWQGQTNKDKSLKYILMPNRTFFKDKKTRLFGEETQDLKDIKTTEQFINKINSINPNLYIDRGFRGKTYFEAINNLK